MVDSNEFPVLVTAVGNPNIDMIVSVDDTYLFEKFNVDYEGNFPMTSEKWNLLQNEIKIRDYKIFVSPGGCSQNTLFVIQTLFGTKFRTMMVGSVGNDQHANFLERELKNSGIIANYTRLDDFKTTSIIILTYKDFRCALYNLDIGAARLFSISDLTKNENTLSSIKFSKIVILEAFFTVHSLDVGLEVTKICYENNVISSFNLNSVNVIRNNRNKIIPFVKACDIVIGNHEEFTELCNVMNLPFNNLKESLTAIHEIMIANEKIPNVYKIKNMQKYCKIIIITNGENPVHCITKCDGVIEHKIPNIKKELIRDTSGAGDAFLGGFLYGILNELPILKCLEIGTDVALRVIQQYGSVLRK